MAQKLLKQLAFMILVSITGMIGLFLSFHLMQWRESVLTILIALLAYLCIWQSYRSAKRVAILMDVEHVLIESKIILMALGYGKESESKGEEQAEREAETSRNNESEDEYSHPV